ncbi:MAG: NADH-quinone oxidoreductase subunit NuoG [Gammaproteobacteria bacterium]
MADDKVTIEVDGKSLEARKGQMLIEVTDREDLYVPRFCYHSKLSVAANCRMCLVEVEKAPKPLPACATPVMDGMVVRTKSKLALDAQKSVMEFLLINHPLDCPICDQGGECELQDLAMGFGGDVSRYQEKKRVVKDKDIGPLVQTDMTRCIHCTRCVRFGEEIAGLRELGATGRGEHMEIGTYVEKSMTSELSGNVIDLCPVGALTSKPFRYSARTWEMLQRPGIAPHDSLGSNLHFHFKIDRIKRVVPAENEAVNEVWLSDRDRFSYEGLYSEDRLNTPMLKINGQWEEVDWEIALRKTAESLRGVVNEHGAGGIGALAAPNATTEEFYLLQKLLRGLGSGNIDHRLRRADFSGQDQDPVFPWLGRNVTELEELDAALIIGGNPRHDQPLLNLRLRKAALKGADIMYLNPVDYEFNYRVAEKIIIRPGELAANLSGVLKAVLEKTGAADATDGLLNNARVSGAQRSIAEKLCDGDAASVFLGNLAVSHPDFSTLRYLAGQIVAISGAKPGYLGEAANSAGACLAGALPHRGPAGEAAAVTGHDAAAMLETPLPGYLLLNTEPELDCQDGAQALRALEAASAVVVITPFVTETMKSYANVLLPSALYAENEGSYVNVEGRRQSFAAVVPPPGEARPAWKILRVLADKLNIGGCAYDSVAAVADDINHVIDNVVPDNTAEWRRPAEIGSTSAGIEYINPVPMYATDSLARRAPALQRTGQGADGRAHLSPALAEKLGLSEEGKISIAREEAAVTLPYVIDDRVPADAVVIHACQSVTVPLGGGYGGVTLQKV